MFSKLSIISVLVFFISCKSINYCPNSGVVYYEYGQQSHYYSDSAENFGIELYNGFIYFDDQNRISEKALPKQIRKALNVPGWEVKFLLVDKLSPLVSAVLQQKQPLKQQQYATLPTFFSAFDSKADTITLKGRDASIYQATKVFKSDSFAYKILSFSYVHKWLKSKLDTPSMQIAADQIESLRSGWLTPDYVREDEENELPLFAHASMCFWRSKNNYLYPLRVINTPASRVKDDNYYDASSTFQSFVGNYQKSLLQRDSVSTLQVSTGKDEHFEGLRISNAVQAILDSASRHSVLMINEGHTQPLNRRFFTTLLAPLYKIGYRSIFYETLDAEDSLINDRRFPMQISGYYTSEPHFGNNVRTALKIGFNVFAYDNDSSDNTRELLQAEKIADYLGRFPKEKVIVFCGYGHLDESSEDSMMAFHLKRLTGIDPLTVDQSKLVEHGNPAFESRLYRHVDSAFRLTEPVSVFREKDKAIPAQIRKHDLNIALPRSTYADQVHPDWQFQMGSQKLNIQLDGSRYAGAILQIFSGDELKDYPYWDLIPITNLQLTAHNNFDYFLEPGRYTIYVTDAKRKVLYERQVVL